MSDANKKAPNDAMVVEGGQVVHARGACVGPHMELCTTPPPYSTANTLRQVLVAIVGSTVSEN